MILRLDLVPVSIYVYVLRNNAVIGATGLGECTSEDSAGMNNTTVSSPPPKPNRPSLAKILLSLEGTAAKQHALAHILQALQIIYARSVDRVCYVSD